MATPITVVKAGVFFGELKDAVRSYHVPLDELAFGLGNTRKYGAFAAIPAQYLLIVSQQKDHERNATGYNVLLSVTSDTEQTSKDIADRFENETKIRLDISVPEGLRTSMQSMFGLTFPSWKKHPLRMMEFLKNGL